MYPSTNNFIVVKRNHHSNKQCFNLNKQSGISLAFLLFAIIVVSLLAAALIRLNSQSNLSVAHQVISTRAFLAAESGGNLQALAIFPVSGGVGACANQDYSFTASGLNGCSASTSCTQINVDGIDYFQVISQGQCNTGQPLQATRTIEIRLKSITSP